MAETFIFEAPEDALTLPLVFDSPHSGQLMHQNHFNLIRFSAALMVLVGHSIPLSMGEDFAVTPALKFVASLAGLGVDIFFAISGFLVCQSLSRSSSLGGFAWRRAVRIYPGLIASVLFCTFLVGPAFTTLPTSEYFGSSTTHTFLLGKSTLAGTLFTGGGSELPGVFADLPFEKSVNASLWTLPWEALMYSLLAVFGLFFGIPRADNQSFRACMLAIITASTVGAIVIGNGGFDMATEQLMSNYLNPATRFSALFFLGACIAVSPAALKLRPVIIVLLAICAALGFLGGSAFYPLYLLTLPIVVIWLGGAQRPRKLLRFNNFGDYSYGIYVFAFPVQQAIVSLTGTTSPLILAALSLPMAIIAGIVSWKCIEKPCLKAKNAIDNTRLAVFPLMD